MKKKTLKKNPSNRKPISYSTEFRLDINLNNFVRKLCPATADFINKVQGSVFTHSMTTIYLSLSAQVAKSTFFM